MAKTKQDIGVFAMEFIDNLTEVEDDVGELEFIDIIFLVRVREADGTKQLLMRTGCSDAERNIQVLNKAVLMEHRTAMREAGADDEA